MLWIMWITLWISVDNPVNNVDKLWNIRQHRTMFHTSQRLYFRSLQHAKIQLAARRVNCAVLP